MSDKPKAKKVIKVPKNNSQQSNLRPLTANDLFDQVSKNMGSSTDTDDIFSKLNMLMQTNFDKPEMKNVNQEESMVIHKAFNENMRALLGWLKTVVPEEGKNYNLLLDVLNGEIAKDPSKPIKEWRKIIKGNGKCLSAYNEENVKEFLRIAPSIPLLEEDFKLTRYWNRLSTTDIEKLWTFFISMQTLANVEQTIPINIYQKLEKMVQGLTRKDGWKDLKPHDITNNFGSIFTSMSREILSNKDLKHDIEEFVKEKEASQEKIFVPESENPTEILMNKFESI